MEAQNHLRAARWRSRILGITRASRAAAQKSPHLVIALVKDAKTKAPEILERVKTDIAFYRDLKRSKKSDLATAAE